MSRPAELAPACDDLFLRNIDPTLSGEVEAGVGILPQQHQLRPAPQHQGNGKAPERSELAAQLAKLEAENDEVHKHLARAVEQVRSLERAESQWKRREEEFDRLIEEKAEVIRHLHTQLQEAKITAELSTPEASPDEVELQKMYDELLREREQLKRDEQELMEQMRHMEISMSRERAELARQRNELQLLHRELQRELDMASRDAGLQEKLAPLYKLQQELGRKSGTESGSRPRPRLPLPGRQPDAESVQTLADQPDTKETKIVRRSGFFRRMFNREQG